MSFSYKTVLINIIPYVNLLFLGQKFAIGAKDISNEETLWLFTFRPNPKKVLRTQSQSFVIIFLAFVPKQLPKYSKIILFP